jgi:hypothetical protein
LFLISRYINFAKIFQNPFYVKNMTKLELTPSATMAIVPAEFLEEMRDALQTLRNFVVAREEKETDEWVDSSEAQRLLKVSSNTWQTYRDQRKIPFSQAGRKIYVRRSDIEAYLQEHHLR